MGELKRILIVGAWLLFLPSSGFAQATLAGVVRDASGGVLPGVTVEASSQVLIEKARTAVTDGTGQYRLTELPPGTYTMTFTLSGFSVVKRENVEVSGSGVIPINTELRVGAIAETITVSGETPVVDTQTTRRQAVLSSDIINTLPATRSYGALLTAVPGLQVGVGNMSAMTVPNMTFFTANGGRANEGRMMIDGLNVAASFNGGGVSTFIYDVANTQEMQVLVSGALGEAENGGPQVNLIPKSGGNTFSGSGFFSNAGTWSTGNNLDDALKGYSLTEPAGLITSYDVSGSGGGPILRDRIWFFVNGRKFDNLQQMPGLRPNLNAGDPTKWTYASNPNREVWSGDARDIYSFRLTGQVTPRNRVGFSHEYQRRCAGSTLTASGDGCRVSGTSHGSDWVALGAIGGTPAAPETFPGLPRSPLLRDASDLVVAGVEQAVAGSRLFQIPVPVGGIWTSAAGRSHEHDPGDRAIDYLRPGQLQLSRAVRSVGLRLRRQRCESERLAHDGLVRHRRPQHEGRLSGLVSEVVASESGQHHAVAVHVQ